MPDYFQTTVVRLLMLGTSRQNHDDHFFQINTLFLLLIVHNFGFQLVRPERTLGMFCCMSSMTY